MGELLVLIACIYNQGCPETSNQYYQTHPNLQEFVRIQQDKVNKVVAPVVLEYGAPIFLAATNQVATIKITQYVYITASHDTNILQFKKDF